MDVAESLAHSKWECKYHVVFVPKYRRKTLYAELRKHLGEVFQGLAKQKECRIEEGHLMNDHVHMLISIPPKYAVAQVIGFLKGKTAIHIARTYLGKRQNFVGQHFWAREYFVSTVASSGVDRPHRVGEKRPPLRRDEPRAARVCAGSELVAIRRTVL